VSARAKKMKTIVHGITAPDEPDAQKITPLINVPGRPVSGATSLRTCLESNRKFAFVFILTFSLSNTIVWQPWTIGTPLDSNITLTLSLHYLVYR
jgi:hypothetical protein